MEKCILRHLEISMRRKQELGRKQEKQLLFFTPALACPIQIEAVVHDFEMEEISHGGFDLLDTGIAEFNHFSALDTDEMIMLFKSIGFFILGQILSKLMFRDQFTMKQEFKGIIDSSTAYSIVGILHMDIKRFRIEVIRTAIDLFQDGITFRCAAQVMEFQVPGKNILYVFKRSAMGKRSQ